MCAARSLSGPSLALLAACLCACSDAARGWQPLAAAAMAPAQQQQQRKALAARDAMFENLLDKLTATLQADGAAGAIGVCKQLAPLLAETVARRHGVRIGRTSDKLRNASNAAPDWAVAPLQRRPLEPTFLAGPGGELGALLPIRVQAPCMQCHGPEAALAEEVRAQLQAQYPDDRATGYALNELRGWFWVEVPPQ